MEQNALDVVKTKINKGITTVSLKTNSSVERAKINTHMESLKAEIGKLKQDIGHKTYVLWNVGNFDIAKIESELLAVKEKQEILNELQSKLQEIENREKEILGQTEQDDLHSNAEQYFCPNCGRGYTQKINFCVKCGCKLI